MFLGGPCPLLYIPGGQGYMKSPSRVLLESYLNSGRHFKFPDLSFVPANLPLRYETLAKGE